MNKSPEQILSTAIAIEQANAKRYGEWAERFRAYDPSAAALMEELMKEELKHEEQLKQMYKECFGSFNKPVDSSSLQPNIEDLESIEDHFFVINENMEKVILKAALKVELHAREFYKDALNQTTYQALRSVYEPLAAFEEEHVNIIQNRLKMLDSTKSTSQSG